MGPQQKTFAAAAGFSQEGCASFHPTNSIKALTEYWNT